MKKSIMFVMAMIVAASTLLTKANKETKMSDTVLENIEALAGNESDAVKVCPIKGGTCIVLIGDSTGVIVQGWQQFQ